MPRRPPTSGQIKKGEVRNPKGSSAKARAMAKVRRMSGDDLADLTSLLLTGDRDEIAKVLHKKDASFIQVLTAKLLIECFNKSDIQIYKAIMDRCVGRSKESVELTGKDGSALELNMTRGEMTLEEKVARADALARARMEAADD